MCCAPRGRRSGVTPPKTVRSYKQLANLERVFRILKSVDLQIRPNHHRLADRVGAVLICLLAYYVE
jgi:hypothetical protein